MTTRGLTVYVYSYASNSIIVHEGLTADGAWGVINAEQGGKPVVYLHWPHDLRKVGWCMLGLGVGRLFFQLVGWLIHMVCRHISVWDVCALCGSCVHAVPCHASS